jgi:hypothetical protein
MGWTRILRSAGGWKLLGFSGVWGGTCVTLAADQSIGVFPFAPAYAAAKIGQPQATVLLLALLLPLTAVCRYGT